ncbi:hypothetical protein [Thiohalorhabdus sp.]|uniref:hypothetical protein n=1 Tax=Thiohalorhabdus sp. TaxID=3094134 RepID=UPI002FC30228
MHELVAGKGRTVYHVCGGEQSPAVYWIRDREAGGILVNTPVFDGGLAAELVAAGGVDFLFLPSARGGADLDQWRDALGAEALAGQDEVQRIPGEVDRPLDGTIRLSRNIRFYTMSGRTPGSTALYFKHWPSMLFLGPVLEPGGDGWPTLIPHHDDWSWENRVMGALGLQDLRFEYVFTDHLDPDTRIGPGAAQGVKAALKRFYA